MPMSTVDIASPDEAEIIAASIRCPALVVHGSANRVAPLASAESLADYLPVPSDGADGAAARMAELL